ncbi:MAG: glycosyltransferase [Thermoleophilia bacterium]|nr:glycosyltransferase [Thermoleophilia bacterium]
MERPVELSIVIPAYNEERRLAPTVRAWLAYLDAYPAAAELVVSDDGSTDRTADVARDAAAGDPRLRLVTGGPNRGKGGAVREGMLAARGAYRFYVDADLNIAPSNVTAAVELLRHQCDMVTGRRSLREYSREESSPARVAAGAAVQALRRALWLTHVADSQAGFKGMRAALAERVFRAATVTSFAFDIEVLYLARRFGARIVEYPVSVEFRGESTYDVRRHLPPFLADIVRIRANAARGAYPGRPDPQEAE